MERKNKILSLLVGSAVGDALGVPFEFLERGTFKCDGMTGYGTHYQPEGTWSDDTSMLLCLAEQIAEGFNLEGLADKFLRWYRDGYMTATGYVFDVGGATQRALIRYSQGIEPIECGGREDYDNGNGSLMRIAPLVFYSTKVEDIRNVSSITHANAISVTACIILIKYLEGLLQGLNKNVAFGGILANLGSDFWEEKLFNLAELPEEKIKSSGYVVDTLRASLWCFLKTDNFKDCVLKAVNLGNDTDTVACIAGAIAGLYYGIEQIPKEWIDKLQKKELIYDIAERMSKAC